MNSEATAPSESKALRLARYLKEFVGLRATTAYDINNYDSVIWFSDLPQEPDCQSPAWSDGFSPGDPWLIVRKQQFPKHPSPPEIVLPWIDQQALSRSDNGIPKLKHTRLEPDTEALVEDGGEPPLIERNLVDYPEVAKAYDQYASHWEAWAQEHQRRSRIQSVYAELFRLHTQIQKQGEVVELVLGLGLLAWRRPSEGQSPAIVRHVFSAKVDLHFEAVDGVIRLDGAADGAQLRIEDDMLEAELRPDRNQYLAVVDQLNDIDDQVWERQSVFSALKAWSGALHPDMDWSPELKVSASSPNRPQLAFAPALILRKRNQVGMVRIYDALIESLRSIEHVPRGWAALVEDEDDADVPEPQWLVDGALSPPRADPSETYFPLPANREQRRIVEALSSRRGVLVQGPPGTGKSHTIANLVCHLLASGKRILITAETGRALKVLKEKLPEEIRPLCVSLLGQGGDSFAELNAAVQAITSRFATWRPGAYGERIAEVDQEIDARRRDLAKIDVDLRSLREDETLKHSLLNGLYAGTASAIAKTISSERARFGWLRLPEDAKDDPPLTGTEIHRWLTICRRYDEQAVHSSTLRTVSPDKLPTPSDFALAVATEKEAREAVDKVGNLRTHPAYSFVAKLGADERADLAEQLQRIEQEFVRLNRLDYGWLKTALAGALDGRQARWQTLLDHSLELIARIEQLLRSLGSRVVSIPETHSPRTIRNDALALIDHLTNGGKWTTLGVLTPKAVKERTYLREKVAVDGLAAETPERLHAVCNHMDILLAFDDLELGWSDVGGLPGGRQPRIRLAAVKEHVGILRSSLHLAQLCREVADTTRRAGGQIPTPDWMDGHAAICLELIEAASLEDRHRIATLQVTECQRSLNLLKGMHDVHPIVGTLMNAVGLRDVTAYSHAHCQVQQIEQLRFDQEFRHRVESTLQKTLPALLLDVGKSLGDQAWDERFLHWERAWRWAIVDAWLGKRADSTYRERLWQHRHDTDERISRLLGESATLRAWTHFFNRLSNVEAAALRGWRETVKAMGMGTGASAKLERLRREARQYMDKCRDAIPVWIMPRYLVAEMVNPAPGRYDLVIVDEASQLGVESLFLFYVAKKMVVVGDDQQISPYGIGITDESIAKLQHHYLEGVPHRAALSAQSSLYANAKIRFGQSIVLREHFRCMPEIIQFSNDLCYASNGTPLDPLRAYPTNRLQPLVVRHVSEGYRTGSSQNATNEPEADAVVAQIIACVGDTRYSELTMGVISLQGEAQARLIEHKLLEALEPEVIEQRRLICGDAYAFQGDERHVVFLTMVAAPGETRIGVLSGDSARQRFNVAASRAQDQLWLFHSVTLDLLSPSCMRHRLLSYLLNPGRRASDRNTKEFDSDFERDVFDVISAKGFHVRTQVCVGDPANHRYRIDLVVEGMQGRLAVECDGDEWHGPDRYEQDMARQRDLERAGWQFVRIRGGNFYRSPENAMQPVWTKLNLLGIRPGGIDESAAAPPPPAATRNLESQEVEEDLAGASSPGTEKGDETNASKEDLIQGTLFYSAETKASPLVNPPTHALFADYCVYNGAPGPDPRTVNLVQVADGLCAIIEAEGPMLTKRAYDTYLRGCGIKRLGTELKSIMNRALASAIRQNRVIVENEPGSRGYINGTVRSLESDPVKLRRRGTRTFEEIPPSEIRAAGTYLAESHSLMPGSEEHLRAILESFDLKRLTAQAQTTLLETLRCKNQLD